jgi:hypothetical protein
MRECRNHYEAVIGRFDETDPRAWCTERKEGEQEGTAPELPPTWTHECTSRPTFQVAGQTRDPGKVQTKRS